MKDSNTKRQTHSWYCVVSVAQANPDTAVRLQTKIIAQSLINVDLLIIEEHFERLLLDYDRVFSTQGIPACLWRRTGEIYKGNKEFANLIGVDIDSLRDGQLCIYELMAEESAVNYWEKYGAVSFDPGQKAVLTSCILRARTHSANSSAAASSSLDPSFGSTGAVGGAGLGPGSSVGGATPAKSHRSLSISSVNGNGNGNGNGSGSGGGLAQAVAGGGGGGGPSSSSSSSSTTTNQGGRLSNRLAPMTPVSSSVGTVGGPAGSSASGAQSGGELGGAGRSTSTSTSTSKGVAGAYANSTADEAALLASSSTTNNGRPPSASDATAAAELPTGTSANEGGGSSNNNNALAGSAMISTRSGSSSSTGTSAGPHGTGTGAGAGGPQDVVGLRTPQHGPVAGAGGSGGSAVRHHGGEEVLIPCCFSFTIRRDQWNIPICIVGNFLMIDPP
ncbi:unnamed protein product [Tilletia controversa]|nr:unnamed protein product [Tilletia controversa]